MNISAEHTYSSQSLKWLPFVFLAVLTLTLRLVGIGDKPLWLDEAYSFWFTDQSWQYLWHEVPKFETHPPFYYSLLKVWRVFGADEGSLRMLSLVFGMLTLPAVYLAGVMTGGKLHGEKIGLLAGFIFATAYWQINSAQDARPYGMMTLFYSWAFVCSVWLLKNPEKSTDLFFKNKSGFVWAALGIFMGLLQWSHNLGALYVFSLGAALAAWWAIWHKFKPALFVNLSFTVLVALAVYAPFIKEFIGQFNNVHGNFWIEKPDLKDLYRYTVRLYGPYFEIPYSVYAKIVHTFVVLPLGACGLLYLWKKKSSATNCDNYKIETIFLLLSAALTPWILCVVLTFTVQPVFLMRLLLPVQIPWFIILACGPFLFDTKGMKILSIILALICLNGAWIYHQNPDINGSHEERAFKDTLIDISNQIDKGTPVLAFTNETGLLLDYYNKKLDLNVNLMPLPEAYPAHGQGIGVITPQNMQKTMASLKGHKEVWLVARGRLSAKSNKDPQDLLIKTLKNSYREEIIKDGGVSIRKYTSP